MGRSAARTTVAVGLTLLLLGPPSPGADPPQTRDGSTALERRIATTVRERGVVASASSETVFNVVPGESTVLRVVEEGMRVRKGDVVVELDSGELERQHRELVIEQEAARAELARTSKVLEQVRREAERERERLALRARLAKLAQRDIVREGGEYDGDLRIAQARLEAATLRAEAFRGDMAGGDRAESEIAKAVAEVELAEATERLRRLESGRERREVELELAVVEAENDAERNRSHETAEARQASAAVEASRAAVELLVGRVEETRAGIDACRIAAPRDGMMVLPASDNRRSNLDGTIEEGAVVRERQTVARIIDPENLEVHVSVHESKIARVEKGQAVKLTFDAHVERTWPGTVVYVSPVASAGSWMRPNVRHYMVTVAITPPYEEIRVGMSVLAEIETD